MKVLNIEKIYMYKNYGINLDCVLQKENNKMKKNHAKYIFQL